MRRLIDDAVVQRWGCSVLASLVKRNSDNNKIEILSEGGVGVILGAIRRFPNCVPVVQVGLEALYSLGYRKDSTSIEIVSEGGIQAGVLP